MAIVARKCQKLFSADLQTSVSTRGGEHNIESNTRKCNNVTNIFMSVLGLGFVTLLSGNLF